MIGDAADRYDMDVAHVWEAILLERVLVAPDGARVRLVAPREDREGDLWIVSEVPDPYFRPARKGIMR